MKPFYHIFLYYHNILMVRDEFYDAFARNQNERASEWNAGSLSLLLLSLIAGIYGIFLLWHKPLYSAIIVLWIAIGFIVLAIDFGMASKIKNWGTYKTRYYYNIFFGVALIANLPFVIISFFVLSSVNKNEIDAETFWLPLKIIPVDWLIIMSILMLIQYKVDYINKIIIKYESAIKAFDLRALLFFAFIVMALIIMALVNYIIYCIIDKQKNKRIAQKNNDILEEATKKTEKISVPDSARKSFEQKIQISTEFQHGWNYIKITIARFQLIVLIYMFVRVAIAPGTMGIVDEQVKSSYLNAITIVTLIMLYMDRHNAWNERIRQSIAERNAIIANSKDKISDCIH